MARNAPRKDLPALDLIPEHYRDFEEVFSKESFDTLPDHRRWDHADSR
jgi:hypothetical protein